MNFINKEFLRSVVYQKRAINQASKKVTESPIMFKSIVIFGYPGSGKTNCANWIAREAVKYYGIDNVNAKRVERGQFEWIIRFGVEPKLVNILFVDNATLAEVCKSSIVSYFNIRHHPSLSSLDKGYVLSIIAVHRFHGCPLEIRTIMDGLIVLDSTLNPYDRNMLQKFCGTDVLSYFDSIADVKHKLTKYKGIAYYKSKNVDGFLKIPFIRGEYIKDVFE